MTTDPTHGLSVPHADALWDAVAAPGPDRPSYTQQHERVCAAVADIISEVTAGQPPADHAGLRDRIADEVRRLHDTGAVYALDAGEPERIADAVVAVLPAPTDQAADEVPATECSAQNRNYESGPRLCIRAAQHRGDHIDEHGFHWGESTAVYPVSDGTFRTGIDRSQLLRRLAGEARQDPAHPSRNRWRTEVLDGTEWVPNSTYVPNRAEALRHQNTLAERHPTWSDGAPIERRLVCEQTTFTAEPAAAEVLARLLATGRITPAARTRQDPTSDGRFVPPAAEGLPLAALESARNGATMLDAWAEDPHGRNFLAHALVQLARDGWLRTEPGEGFEPMRDPVDVPEPQDPAAVARPGQPDTETQQDEVQP